MYKQNRFLEIYTKLINLHHQRVTKRFLKKKKEMNIKEKKKEGKENTVNYLRANVKYLIHSFTCSL